MLKSVDHETNRTPFRLEYDSALLSDYVEQYECGIHSEVDWIQFVTRREAVLRFRQKKFDANGKD